MFRHLTLVVMVLFLIVSTVHADEKNDAPPEEKSERKLWLITPLFSSDPKIATSAGLLGGYVPQFDEKSPPSFIGVAGTYSTTASWYLSANRHQIGG